MSKIVYEIVTYNLKGGIIKTFKPRLDLTVIIDRDGATIVDIETGRKPEPHRLYDLSTSNAGCLDANQEFLPYVADVTEDLPNSCRGLTPKTYTNCKLMTEKHGGYLQFYDADTKEVLRIAMNSHSYEPIK